MQSVISKDRTTIAYDRTGRGPAVILVSGAFSYRKYPASVQVADLLAQHFTVFNYDRRGRGDSGDTKPYAVEREIEDLQALIDAAGGSAYVWGLSSGAILALKAAASGLALKKLALQESPLFVNANDRQPPKDFTAHLTHLITSDRRDEAVKYFMTKGMGAPGFVIPLMHLMPVAWKQLTAVAHTLPYDAQLLEGYTAGKPLSGKDWKSVTMQTLVMAGSESPAFLRHGAQALAEALPHARLLTQKGLAFIHTQRTQTTPLDALAYGWTSGTDTSGDAAHVAAFAQAEATWWLEHFSPQQTVEQVRERIQHGPPRLS
jgi:pimeloyl-ACP methyl ester carboxylesterase